jgi:photosystem II stability/assembly factor-like uncharacterized protein
MAMAMTTALQAQPAEDPNVVHDPSLFSALEYRTIGPYRGGRVTAVTGIADRPFTFFMGSTGGGVWKTVDAGETWENVSDGDFDVGSIGAIDVADSDASVIYVGTGSAGIRGNVSIGRGVYRSYDGGKSWEHVGLREAGAINRVVVHPEEPELVYVAALGNPFGKNEERGVFRTRDGGESWEKVLFVADSVGAIDLAMNPANPRVLYAGMWRAERKPWTLVDASEDGGVFKTTDGGDTWEKLAGGLPEGLTGKIGLAVSPANPDRVWALVNAHDPEGGVYRSDDAGATWERVNRDHKLRQRHWYYSHIDAHPTDENTVFVQNTRFYRSIDGGGEFDQIDVHHGDVHDLWINPTDPDIMIVSNDGGAQVSLTGGGSWSTLLNQPTAEFYRVTVDDQFPYRVYGAQQDNSTITVPSWSPGGITPTQEWYSVAGAESGHIAVTPGNPDLVYAGNYLGRIDRYDHRTRSARNVIAYPQMQDGTAPKELKYRFQWNAPIVISPHDPETVYHTSNYVHRTRDGGMTWETISPDLTTNDTTQQELPGGPLQHDHTGVEVYNTVFAFAESPHTAGVLWAGSDDGLIHLSQDAGASWTNVSPADMPDQGTVNAIELSPHAEGRAYVSVYNYRMDDWRPFVFRTNDFGATWTLLTDGRNGIAVDTPVRVVREDPEREGLLYAGTEFGMFVSFDDGAHWQSLQLKLPRTPITDLRVYRDDLVVATQGRSFWILDDLTPLHDLGTWTAGESPHLLSPRHAYRASMSGRYRGDRAPEAPPQGATIHYHLNEAPEGELTVEILDGEGRVLRTYTGAAEDEEDEEDEDEDEDEDENEKEPDKTEFIERKDRAPQKAGLNRLVWDLKAPGPRTLQGSVMSLGYTGGAWIPPGTYQVRLSVDGWSDTRELEVRADPRLPVSQEDLDEQYRVTLQARDMVTASHEAIRAIRLARGQLTSAVVRVQAGDHGDEVEKRVREAADSAAAHLTVVEERLIQTKNESGQDPINFPPRLDNQLVYLYGHVNAAYGPPTQGAMERLTDLRGELDARLTELEALLSTELADFNRLLEEAGVQSVVVPTGRRPVS